jgi:repressor LexA
MLTEKQRDLLLFINSRMKGTDIAPSFEEMKNALDLKSKSGIHRLISALVERGYIERLPHRARALRILQLPDGMKADNQSNTDKQLDADKNVFREAMQTLAGATFDTVPVFGKIAAGTPIEAISHEHDSIPLPPGMIGAGEHYALTIDGDSMIKAGINNHDTVIIKRCDSAENGTIIVALVDGEEATLKRLRRAGGKIVLEPENDDYEPQILEPERVEIQGRLAGLIRSYH